MRFRYCYNNGRVDFTHLATVCAPDRENLNTAIKIMLRLGEIIKGSTVSVVSGDTAVINMLIPRIRNIDTQDT